MKCIQCSFDSEQDFRYCPVCGAEQTAQIVQNSAAQTVLCALKDKLFLALCILVSASCILSLAADIIPLLSILATVFLWITYAKSRQDIADYQQLRRISGTIYAQYVITNVLGVLFMVVGVICIAAFDAIVESSAFLDVITQELGTDILPIAELTGTIWGAVFVAVFMIIGVLILVLNIFSMRYIHRFVKSIYQSIPNGVLELKHVNAAKVWLFIFGGFSGFSALTSVLGSQMLIALTNGIGCGIYIIAGLLVNKYFIPKSESV